jgi:hypothetical protein
LKHYLKTPKRCERSTKRIFIFKETSGLLPKNVLKNKKIRSLNNNEGNEQVENKKTTTKNKVMQTQQRE